MKIFADIAEAAERFEELMDLAVRKDEVVICRAGQPVAVLTPIPKPSQGTMDDIAALAAAGRPTFGDQTSNHDEFYDEHGVPR